MLSVQNISDLQSPWLMWLMMALLVAIGWAYYRQPAWIRSVTNVVSGKIERSYADTRLDYITLLLLIGFVLGTFGTAAYVLFATAPFSVAQWGIAVGLTALFMMLKALGLAWIEWTFGFAKRLAVSYTQYLQGYVLMGVALFVWILLWLQFRSSSALQIVLWVILALFMVLWFIKGIKLIHKPVSVLYILIFIIAGEFLPIAALGWAVNRVLEYEF